MVAEMRLSTAGIGHFPLNVTSTQTTRAVSIHLMVPI